MKRGPTVPPGVRRGPSGPDGPAEGLWGRRGVPMGFEHQSCTDTADVALKILMFKYPPSYAMAMLCHPGLAIAKAIASWDHRHHGCARSLDIQALIVARSRLLSQPP